MATKTVSNIEVGYDETEIIESTATDSSKVRKFRVTNRDKEIVVTVLGSNDNREWEMRENVTISPNKNEIIDVEINHNLYIKLVGKTTTQGDRSKVDATFTYTEP